MRRVKLKVRRVCVTLPVITTDAPLMTQNWVRWVRAFEVRGWSLRASEAHGIYGPKPDTAVLIIYYVVNLSR